MSVIVGLDISLTSTGWARIDGGKITVGRITSKGKATATLADRMARMVNIADALDAATNLSIHDCGDRSPDLIVVEGPSLDQSVSAARHDRSGLWWWVIAYHVHPSKVVEVPPTCLKKYATGKGNAGKDAVLAAVVRRYPDVEITGNDEADALILAAMGARHLGEPIEASLPAVNLAAMDRVAWSAERAA